MKRKTSIAAIIVAVIFSILLFPMIFIGGIASGVVFSIESAVLPDREEDLYRSFEESGGMDWVYEFLVSCVEEGMYDGTGAASMGIELSATELFPRNQVETMVYDVYHKVIKGEEYQFDFTYQKEILMEKLTEAFDANATTGDNAELIKNARETYLEEIEVMLEDELGLLENELSREVNGIYEEIYETMDIGSMEEQIGYSLTDRTELCSVIRLIGYVALGITAFLLAMLLLCHLFRPAGFVTAGAFCLVTGGFMLAASKIIHNFLMSIFYSELSAELSAEEIPEFFLSMVKSVLGWFLTGFEKVGKIGLITAVVLILVGILLYVIKQNQAEPISVYEMQ